MLGTNIKSKTHQVYSAGLACAVTFSCAKRPAVPFGLYPSRVNKSSKSAPLSVYGVLWSICSL
ncbi:hypothetical protein OH77DRAFT_1418611, partial [Trametes cingulata]